MIRIIAVAIFGIVFSAQTSASLVDNGNYISDTVTGIDWSDFSRSWNKSYSQAQTDNVGWRHATNAEVTGLFAVLFDGYFDTDPLGYSTESGGGYSDQRADVLAFETLFGSKSTYAGQIAYGYYLDENDVMRFMGSRRESGDSWVFGNYDFVYSGAANPDFGSFLVRDLSPIPIPAAIWLFGTALIGLVGLGKRRETV